MRVFWASRLKCSPGRQGLIALKEDGWRVAAAHGIAPAFLSYLTPLLAEENVRELNVTELNRMLKELTYTASMGLLNGTALPLAAHGQVIGVIFIFRNYPDLFTPNDRVLLQSFADQAAIAVYNARLYGQVSYEKQRLDALLDSAADGILDPQRRPHHRTRATMPSNASTERRTMSWSTFPMMRSFAGQATRKARP